VSLISDIFFILGHHIGASRQVFMMMMRVGSRTALVEPEPVERFFKQKRELRNYVV
jgi:hypothetical protein